MHHALTEFLFRSLCMLSQPVGFIHHDQRILRKIIQKRHCIFIKIMNKILSTRKMLKFLHLIFYLFHQIADTGSFLCLKFVPQLFLNTFCFLFQGFYTCRDGFFIQNHLRSRINSNLIQIFYGTLTLHIKTANRIDLISPQFDSPGIILCQRVHVHNSSPYRKLPRGFYLWGTLITHFHHTGFHFIQIQLTVIFQIQNLAFPYIQRNQIIQTTVYGSNYCGFLLLNQCLHYLNSLAGKQISMNVRLVKNQISCRI